MKVRQLTGWRGTIRGTRDPRVKLCFRPAMFDTRLAACSTRMNVTPESARTAHYSLSRNSGKFGSRSTVGGLSPKCRYAVRVAMRPRAVRMRKPC